MHSTFAVQVSVYIGSHDHQISTANYLDIENALENQQFAETETPSEESSEVDDSKPKESSEADGSKSKESSDDFSSLESSDEDVSFSSVAEETQSRRLSKYEEKIKKRCVESFPSKVILVNAKRNEIEANSDKIYILKLGDHEKISTVAKDGYLYESNTTRKKMPQILDSQGLAYSYQCQGKLVCRNSECPVLNRLTVLNSFPLKKTSSRTCRFCKSTLEKEDCDGLKYILRSKGELSNLKGSKVWEMFPTSPIPFVLGWKFGPPPSLFFVNISQNYHFFNLKSSPQKTKQL